MAAAGEAQTVKGALHQPFAGSVQRAELPDHGGGHIGIAGYLRAGKALLLHLPGGVDTFTDDGGGLRLLFAAHGLVLHGGNLDIHVDAVQQGTGDAAHVLVHLIFRAGAAAGGVAVPAALAGVHGAHQHEAAGQRQRSRGAGDGDKAVLQRLAQRLQRRLVELRQLVQKQDAPRTG